MEVAVKTVLFSDNTDMGKHNSNAEGGAQPQQRAILEAAVCTSVINPNVVITYHYGELGSMAGVPVCADGCIQVSMTSMYVHSPACVCVL